MTEDGFKSAIRGVLIVSALIVAIIIGLVAVGTFAISTEIEEKGLKNIIEEIWEGPADEVDTVTGAGE